MNIPNVFPKIFRLALICSMLIFLTNVEAFAGNDKNNLKSKKSSQSQLWQKVDETNLAARGQRSMQPEKYLIFRLNQTILKNLMAEMPLEFTGAAAEKNVLMEMPLPDGNLSRFRVEESQVLAPHLAADFPEWKTFNGYGIDEPTAAARFDWTSEGFHGYIFTSKGTVYIEPFQKNDTENYIVFYKHEFGKPMDENFSCKVTEQIAKTVEKKYNPFEINQFANGGNIRTYRIAVATTGEWSRAAQGNSSTDPSTIRTAALAALTTTINRLDGIYRRELAVSFQLVNPAITNETANIIYDDPATDPYDNTDSGAQLNINQTTLNNRVGAGNYDIGHLYGTGGGGIAALGAVCSTSKAEGYSARGGVLGDPFTVDYVAHEIGHQFGAEHTYNNSDPSGACTTRSANSAYEVASGSTIMSYVGICSNRNLQQYVDTVTPSFHIQSLTQAITYIQTGDGANCGTASGTNAVPTINALTSYTIPKLTPFTLTASATDADDANLLYSWEEFDLAPSPSGVAGTPANSYDVDTDGVLRPLFRSYSPVSSSSRTFPSLTFILNPAGNNPAGSNNPPLTYQGTHPTGFPGAVCETGVTCVVGESLPTVNRTMNFRVAVRDGRGGTADAGMTVTVAAAAGPFRVTTQDAFAPPNWQAGTTQTVTWDVAGTDANGINAANVNILLSTDGGQTFPVTLKANTPNDGSEQITVPNNPTAQARIKVEAVGNIFFDISNVNFQITAPTSASVSIAGRVLSGSGRGISNVSVSIVDQNGAVRTVRTSPFGYYRFGAVAAGQNYTVTAVHKHYRFAPQSVFVGDAISGLNFIAEN